MNIHLLAFQVKCLRDLFKHLWKIKDFPSLIFLCSPALISGVCFLLPFLCTVRLSFNFSLPNLSLLQNVKQLVSHHTCQHRSVKRTVKKKGCLYILVPCHLEWFCHVVSHCFKRRCLGPAQPVVNRKVTIWMRERPSALLDLPSRHPLSNAFLSPHF